MQKTAVVLLFVFISSNLLGCPIKRLSDHGDSSDSCKRIKREDSLFSLYPDDMILSIFTKLNKSDRFNFLESLLLYNVNSTECVNLLTLFSKKEFWKDVYIGSYKDTLSNTLLLDHKKISQLTKGFREKLHDPHYYFGIESLYFEYSGPSAYHQVWEYFPQLEVLHIINNQYGLPLELQSGLKKVCPKLKKLLLFGKKINWSAHYGNILLHIPDHLEILETNCNFLDQTKIENIVNLANLRILVFSELKMPIQNWSLLNQNVSENLEKIVLWNTDCPSFHPGRFQRLKKIVIGCMNWSSEHWHEFLQVLPVSVEVLKIHGGNFKGESVSKLKRLIHLKTMNIILNVSIDSICTEFNRIAFHLPNTLQELVMKGSGDDESLYKSIESLNPTLKIYGYNDDTQPDYF